MMLFVHFSQITRQIYGISLSAEYCDKRAADWLGLRSLTRDARVSRIIGIYFTIS